MPLNPPLKLTKTQEAKLWVAQRTQRSEAFLYRHAPVIAAFMAGIIFGYVVGAR